MKILHTADLHLNEQASERWDALVELVNLGRKYQVSALVIAGDLFDQDVAAETMRNKLRSIIGSSEFQTILLPGNHDHKAYRSGLYFGENVSVIHSWEEPVRLGELVFWGLPYERISKDRLVGRLREMALRMQAEEKNILLFHGELLDAYFSRQDMGNEGELRYMPAKLSYFEPLPLQYVLAGHFHSRYASWQIPGGGLFISPGSPVAVTRKETGRRMANLLVTGEAPVEINLDSFHFERITVTLDPYTAKDPLIDLDHKLDYLHPAAKVLLTVEGLFNGFALGMNEKELALKISEKAGQLCAGEPVLDFLDVRYVLEDDLFKKFMARLDQTDYPPKIREQAKELALQAFRGVK